MTLAECLAQTGVQLEQKIGFIVETGNDEDGWVPYHAQIGRVQTDIPCGARDQEDVQDYDPEYDLLVVWQAGASKHLYMLRMTDDAIVYGIEPGGIAIIKDDSRIFVGQSAKFMQSVCDTMCALA